MAKRENNYSRTQSRTDYKEIDPALIESTLDYLENTGKLKSHMVLPPRHISPRAVKYYDIIIQIQENLKKFQDYDDISDILNEIDDTPVKFLNISDNRTKDELFDNLQQYVIFYQTRLINLSTIVMSSVIKKFKTLYPQHFQDTFTACVVDVLDKISKNKYDKNKSQFHSYVYETSYQAIIKYINEKAQYENKTVQLLQE